MSGRISSPIVFLAVSVLTVAGAGRIGAAEDGFHPIEIPDPFLNAGLERTDEPGWFPYAGIPHDLAGFPSGRQTLADVECAYNEIAHSDKEGIDCKGGPRHVRIHHNYVHHITFYTGLYVDVWSQPMRHVQAHHNVVGNNRGSGIQISSEGGPVLEDLTVRNNVCFSNKFSGILLGAPGRNGPRKGIRILSNTVSHNGYAHPNRNPGGGIHVGTKNVTDLVIRNNICFDNKDYAIVTQGQDLVENNIRIDHNLCYPPRELGMLHPTYFSPLGENPVQADPMFMDPIGLDFPLRAKSPAIDAGHPEDRDADGTRADLGAIAFAHSE